MIASMVCGMAELAIHFNLLHRSNGKRPAAAEGTVMTPNQLGLFFSSIATHLINDKVSSVIIGPDDCGGWSSQFTCYDILTLSLCRNSNTLVVMVEIVLQK